ncbi:MAG: CheR family methyltransferase [Solirubrobacteraceae bacterium]
MAQLPRRAASATAMHALERACDLPLSIYRDRHVEKQLVDAMHSAGASSIDELGKRVRADGALRARLRARIANSLTAPFRDREQFELIERELLPPLLARGGGLRLWSAGCSDGSELFSLATLLAGAGALGSSYLLGSDILAENLARARAATACKPPAVARRLRWERRELSGDGPPGGAWDMVLCRNVAIYLRPDARERVYRTLATALAPAGALMLGRSERIAEPQRYGLREIAPHVYGRAS